MTDPAPVTPAPAPAQTPADPKAAAVTPALPKPVEHEQKPATLEDELATKFGPDWAALTPAVKQHLLASEQKTRDADKKYQLIAKIQKDNELSSRQMAGLIQALKEDPMGVLANPALGHDVKSLAEKIVWDNIQEQRMSPEQKRMRELETENNRFKKGHEAAEKQRQEALQAEATKARRDWFEKSFVETLQRHGMPADPQVFGQMAYNVKLFKREGRPLDLDAIALKTRQDFMRWTNSWQMNTPDDKISENIPEDFIKKIRKWDLARLRAKGLAPKPGPKAAGDRSPEKSKGNGKMTMTDWLDQRNQRLGR
jgi:hypothetical protein